MSARTETRIPCVDVAPLVAGDAASSAGRAAAQALATACERVGFVVVRGHGVSDDAAGRMLAAARAFFALPAARKLSIAPKKWNAANANAYRGYFPSHVGGKEGLDLGDPRLAADAPELVGRPYHETLALPSELGEGFAAAVEGWFAACFALGRTLLGALVGELGGDPARVDAGFARPASLTTLRLNHYPAGIAPVEISSDDGAPLACETHVDSGVLTLVFQDEQGGLEVRDADGRWTSVPYAPDAFVVNTGLALEQLTAGRLRATAHRVRALGGERISIPFFLEPAHDVRIAPTTLGIAGAGDAGQRARTNDGEDYESFLRRSLAKFVEYDRGDG